MQEAAFIRELAIRGEFFAQRAPYLWPPPRAKRNAARYDKFAERFASFVTLTASAIWLD
jgi:hypothetical protein